MKNFNTLSLKIQLLEYYQDKYVEATCEFLEICTKIGLKKVGIGYFNKDHFKTSRSYIETFYPDRMLDPGDVHGSLFGDGFSKKNKFDKYQKIWTARNLFFEKNHEYFSKSGNRGQASADTKRFVRGIYSFENNKWILLET